jgi:restriction system protein
MPIPDYQTLMLPLLKLVSDKKDHKLVDLYEVLAKQFNLSEEEQKELLPSGQSFVFNNRVGWARTYLKKSGLLDSQKRGIITITDRGTNLLKENPQKIDVKLLQRFPEFIEFKLASKDDNDKSIEISPDVSVQQTPEELLEGIYHKLKSSLAQELINRIIVLTPSFFEKLVVELLVKMGYGGSLKDAGKAIGKTNDEGIDGTIKEDKLGLDIIYIQAKRWKPGNVVGRPELHKFVGALAGQGAKKGIFITTSSFSSEATNYIPRNDTKIVLIDGEQLAQLMIDYGLGVTTQQTYEVKRMDSDYFEED